MINKILSDRAKCKIRESLAIVLTACLFTGGVMPSFSLTTFAEGESREVSSATEQSVFDEIDSLEGVTLQDKDLSADENVLSHEVVDEDQKIEATYDTTNEFNSEESIDADASDVSEGNISAEDSIAEIDSISFLETLTPDREVSAGDFEYALQSSRYTITKYKGNAEKVEVPREIDGHLITAIGDTAFKDNVRIKRIVLPDGIVRFGKRAFWNCTNLECVNIPSSLLECGYSYEYKYGKEI